MAAWGEYRVGAGRGSPHLLLVTVGTGIGGGIVTDGRIYRGAHGFAAEIGHIIVEPGGPAVRLRQPRVLGDRSRPARRSNGRAARPPSGTRTRASRELAEGVPTA